MPSPNTSHAGTQSGESLQSGANFTLLLSSAKSSRASIRVNPKRALTLRNLSSSLTFAILPSNPCGTVPLRHWNFGNSFFGFSLTSSFHSGVLMSSGSFSFFGLRSSSMAAHISSDVCSSSSGNCPMFCHMVIAKSSICLFAMSFKTDQLSATSCASSFLRVGMASVETVDGNQLFVAPRMIVRNCS